MTKPESVSIIIFDESKKKVLLIKRRDIPVWVLPGGGIEADETPEEAALREATEEVGCPVTLIRKIAEYTPVNKLTLFTHFFEAQLAKNASTSLGDETSDIGFFEELPDLMPPPYQNWIQDAKLFSKDLIQKQIEGVNYFVLIKKLLAHPILVTRFLLTKIGIHINS